MKKLSLFLFTILSVLMPLSAGAYDFSAVNDDGVTIYYSVTSAEELTVERIKGGLYKGNVNIPSVVSYLGKEFKVTKIGTSAFHSCFELTSVTIPDSVTSIGAYAFSSCSGLTSITIPDSVTSIRECAFSGCTGLTSITIPDFVNYIGEYAFSGCTGLTSITIPDSVTSIREWTFLDCTGLTSLTLGKNVKRIRYSAFENCDNLKDVWSLNPTSPECEQKAFDPEICSVATLHVPQGALDAYKNAPVWKDFGTITALSTDDVELIETAGSSIQLVSEGNRITVRGCEAGESVEVYDLTGNLLYEGNASADYFAIPLSLTKGEIYLVRIGGRTVKYMF